MSYHIAYSHSCPACGAFYIPYDTDIPCPRCQQMEQERFDYITNAAEAMRIHKQQYGRYTPGAFWVGTLGDHILMMLFGIFDGFERDKQGKEFQSFLDENLASRKWGDQAYLQTHIRSIALRVRESLIAGKKE